VSQDGHVDELGPEPHGADGLVEFFKEAAAPSS
jgi:hypothetical protein